MNSFISLDEIKSKGIDNTFRVVTNTKPEYIEAARLPDGTWLSFQEQGKKFFHPSNGGMLAEVTEDGVMVSM
ncbi:MAG: hypothetical protein ACRC1D_09420 [Culicoidibacterales bacterium]